MAQLVGQTCVRCGERISNELDAQFCGACGSPVHNRCAQPGGDGCPMCGALGAVPLQPDKVQLASGPHKPRMGCGRTLLWVAGGSTLGVLSGCPKLLQILQSGDEAKAVGYAMGGVMMGAVIGAVVAYFTSPGEPQRKRRKRKPGPGNESG